MMNFRLASTALALPVLFALVVPPVALGQQDSTSPRLAAEANTAAKRSCR